MKIYKKIRLKETYLSDLLQLIKKLEKDYEPSNAAQIINMKAEHRELLELSLQNKIKFLYKKII
jgi:hypothetical protein